MDVSEMSGAPVAPSGALRMRPKADGTTLQLSHNGGAYFDIGGGGAGGTLTGKWLWSNATTGAPATGVVAINNADPSLATEIRIHETTNESIAFAGSFDLVIPGSDIYVQDADDATRWVRYSVTAPATDHGDYRHWPVSLESYGGVNFNNGEVVNLQFISSGAGAIPRLDQILDPTDISTFEVGNHQVVFHFSGAEAEECFVIESLSPSAGSGSVLLLRASGSTAQKAPLRIEGRGAFYMSVAADGKVAIGTETGLVHKLNVYHSNTGGTNVGAIHGSVTLGSGNTAVSMTGSELNTSDAGNTTALLAMTNLDLNLDRETTAVANSSLVCTNVSASSNINANTNTVRNLSLSLQVHNAATVTTWEAIRISAPATFGGGVVSNKYAIVTAAGAGNVGLGTTTPTAQLHVAGAVEVDHSLGQYTSFYKTSDTNEAIALAFYRAKATAPGDLTDGFGIGALVFHSPVSGVQTQSSYIRSFVTDAAGGVIHVGAGAIDQARLAVSQSASLGTAGLIAGSNYFQVRSDGYIFNHGTTGSIYHRDAAGYFVNLDIFSHATDPDDEGKVLTVYDVGSGVLLPRWMPVPAVSGGTPASPSLTLQYNNAGAFGAVTSSIVSGANVTLGGVLTLTGATTLIHIIEKTTHVASATGVGQFTFRGDRSGVMTNFGMIRAYWNDAFAQNTVIEMGMYDASNRVYISAIGAILEAASGTHYVQVLTSGVRVSSGIDGGVFYQSSSNLVCTIAGTTSQYLKGGTSPSWGSIDAAHITTGTLALARGGTGASLADPDADRMLFWDDSAGAVTWLTAGSGLTISGTTLTAVGGSATPGGTTLQVQYNNAGALGGITGFEVSSTAGAPNMVLGGGYFQIAAGLTASVPNIDQEFFISATTAAATRFVMRCFRDITDGGYIQFDRSRGSQAAKTTLINDDTVGKFIFNGYWDSAARQAGYIRSWYDGTYGGGRLDLGAGAQDDFARITMLDTGSAAAITMFGSSSYYFQVSNAGYLFAGGAAGTLWYTTSGGYFVPTATPPAADRIAFWDASAGTVTWLTAGTGLTITGTTMTASGGGGTPGGSSGQLQYNMSGAFGGITDSIVSGANLQLGGTLTLSSASALTHIIKKTTHVSSATAVATVIFRGDRSGVDTPFGMLRAYWNDAFSHNTVIELGVRDTSTNRVYVSDIGAFMESSGGTHYIQLLTTGIRLSSGVNSGVFYQNTSNFAVCTAAGTSSQYLKGGTAPSWGSLDAAHMTSGTLALARGGTGSSLTDPGADRIMFWDDSAGIVDWLIPGTGLTITDKTITAGSTAVFTSGSKALTDNTRTALFSVSFDAADHKGVGGVVHFSVITKQVSGSVQVQLYRVSATFTAVHYGNFVGFGRWGNTYNTDGVTSTGSTAFTFDCNGTNHPSYASGANLYTFYITSNSDLTAISEMTIYFNIEYTGDKAITLV